MNFDCTGIIISGGENKRFGNHNKAFAMIGSLRIIDRVYRAMNMIFDEIIIVTNKPIDYLDFNCYITTDHYSNRSSLNGIYAGLFAASTRYSFVVGCDNPFIETNLISFIVKKIEHNKDIIVPKTSSGFEPLFAIYSKTCLKFIKKQLEQNNFKISNLFNKVSVKELKEYELRKKDPTLSSFFNVNTPNCLTEAKNILGII